MRKQNVYFIISCLLAVFSFSCAMSNVNLKNFIIGEWVSKVRDTEWGPLKMKIIFAENRTFKIEGFYGGEMAEPMSMTGSYRLEGSRLYAGEWNKGKPIEMTILKSKLLLKINNEETLILSRE